MGVAGRKPKPEDQRRNRVKSPFEWRDILNRPFTDPPPLPPFPGRPRGTKAPEPRRPLDTAGRGLWDEVWRTGGTELIDPSALLQLCELMDERIALRERVLSDGEWRERSALRVLDAQLAAGLAVLSTKGVRTPHAWPQATRRWWAAVSTMAHCSIWADAD